MTNSDMIISSGRGLTFMYRIGGIAIHHGRLLVEHNVKHDFCFVPGGRVEYGENAMDALGREVREELGEDIKIGRLVLVADNLFEMGGEWFQEITLYFLIEFTSGSRVFDWDGPFEGSESGTIFQWLPLDEMAEANLLPVFLRKRVTAVPPAPEYLAYADADSSSRLSPVQNDG